MDQYCSNCEKTLAQSKFDLHLGYCRRNIRKCPNCSRPFDINEQDEHNQQYHRIQKCQFCDVMLPMQQINNHMQSCPKKRILCQHCDLNIPHGEYQEHLKSCEARTQTCQKCQQAVQRKIYYPHLVQCQGPILNNDADRYASSGYSSNDTSSHISYPYPQQSQSPQVVQQRVAQSVYQRYPTTVTRVTYQANNDNNGSVRHQVRQIGQRTIINRIPNNQYSSPVPSLPTTSIPNSQLSTHYSSSYTHASHASPLPYINSTNSYAMSQYGNQQHLLQHQNQFGINETSFHHNQHQVSKTKSEPDHYGSNYQNFGRGNDFGSLSEEDSQLQAVLLASMGCTVDSQHDLQLQIQKQMEIENMMKKK